MIVDLFTRPWAQWSYDHMREYGPGDRVGQPLAHLVIQAANVAANVAPAMILTSMSNPHVMSYAYKGLDPMKFGLKAAMQSRKEFQIASSQAYQIGEAIGRHIAWPSDTGIMVGNSKKARRARALMSKGGRIGGKVAFRAIPGLGYGLLAYDVYDLTVNQRLFGIDL